MAASSAKRPALEVSRESLLFPFKAGENKKRRGQNCFALVTQSLPLLFFPLPPPSFTAFFLPFLLSAVSQCTAKGELPLPPPLPRADNYAKEQMLFGGGK